MKAVLLAAGKGSRIKELSDVTPKPMFKYKGKPIIEHNIELCKRFSIDEIYINTHHHAKQIKEYVGSGEKYNLKINYSFENKLLGTSGALLKFKEYLNKEPFYVIYSDQIADFDLQELINKYNENKCLGVIAFHYREDVFHSGVAEFDSNYKVEKFIEKPKPGESESHWVNAGIYLLNPDIYNLIPNGFSDFGKDIFPKILSEKQNIYGVCSKREVKVFDTIEMYNKNIKR